MLEILLILVYYIFYNGSGNVNFKIAQIFII